MKVTIGRFDAMKNLSDFIDCAFVSRCKRCYSKQEYDGIAVCRSSSRLFSVAPNQSRGEPSTKTLSHPGLIITALGLHVFRLYLSQLPSYLHLESCLSITGEP